MRKHLAWSFAILLLLGATPLLSACNTVAGAGQGRLRDRARRHQGRRQAEALVSDRLVLGRNVINSPRPAPNRMVGLPPLRGGMLASAPLVILGEGR